LVDLGAKPLMVLEDENIEHGNPMARAMAANAVIVEAVIKTRSKSGKHNTELCETRR
jgi:hypothetical protein